jgi:hypothetical protein
VLAENFSRNRALRAGDRKVSALAVVTVVLATACAEGTTPADDARTVQIGRSGESTYVSISETNVKKNPLCVQYCDRLAQCWYAVSTGSEAMTPDEARKRCLSEQDDCRVRTKASFCCGALADCLEFSECHAKTNDEPAECRVQAKP